MKQRVFIVGITGSLGKALADFYTSKSNSVVIGSSSKPEFFASDVFHIDFCNPSTLNNVEITNVDHLIIASGYEPKYNLKDLTDSHLNKMFEIHVLGPIKLIQRMQNMFSPSSSITFISSPAAWQGSYDPSYAAVKGAVNSLVRTLAKDLAPKTRVNALSPSLIEDSTVFEGMTEDFRKRHVERTLNKRLLSLHECVEAVDFIIKSSHFTGQVLHLNGGMVFG